jgi:hypothetical protein
MMTNRSLRNCIWSAVIAVLPLTGPDRTSATSPQGPGGSNDHAPVLIRPTRRPPDAPPALPPNLPAEAEQVAPLTLRVSVRQRRSAARAVTTRQTISRTARHIHIQSAANREWLFERNSRDPRRVSGFLTDHVARAVVLYDESDLRNMLGITGCADVLALGMDPTVLSGLRRTNQHRSLSGLRFVRYVADDKDAAISDVWWNEAQGLPCAFVSADKTRGTLRLTIDRLRPGVDSDLLRAPIERFSTYRVFDLADWLEGR